MEDSSQELVNIRNKETIIKCYFYESITHLCLSSVDPDETLQNTASHQGLHYMPLIQQFLVTSTGKKLNFSQF